MATAKAAAWGSNIERSKVVKLVDVGRAMFRRSQCCVQAKVPGAGSQTGAAHARLFEQFGCEKLLITGTAIEQRLGRLEREPPVPRDSGRCVEIVVCGKRNKSTRASETCNAPGTRQPSSSGSPHFWRSTGCSRGVEVISANERAPSHPPALTFYCPSAPSQRR
ncbi:hypothetical protein G7046_g6355 [Stylonectria norvegica]|nr:hypothetical protein G7046_g6355 [Stylonectria norvegica]